jgi:hypothetical protein
MSFRRRRRFRLVVLLHCIKSSRSTLLSSLSNVRVSQREEFSFEVSDAVEDKD